MLENAPKYIMHTVFSLSLFSLSLSNSGAAHSTASYHKKALLSLLVLYPQVVHTARRRTSSRRYGVLSVSPSSLFFFPLFSCAPLRAHPPFLPLSLSQRVTTRARFLLALPTASSQPGQAGVVIHTDRISARTHTRTQQQRFARAQHTHTFTTHSHAIPLQICRGAGRPRE